jgi:predicted ATP-dependent serine protease
MAKANKRRRALTVENLYSKKYDTYEFDGIFKEIFGNPSTNGIWIIYGKDKNGKTWGTLLISDYLSQFKKVWYISAEEGMDMEFQAAVKRANIDAKNKNLHFDEYVSIEAIRKRLKSRKPPKVVVIDNLSMYKGELTSDGVTQLKLEFPKTHFIMVAHEDRGKPYTAAAVMAMKLAKVIIRVQGLALLIGGRVPGGSVLIDEAKAIMYHGTQIKQA